MNKPSLTPILSIDFEGKTTRRCGDCQLCCKLLPMPELNKADNTRCQHQQASHGCKIYARRPSSCRLWSCRWLAMNDTADMRRPDRVHYVLDPIPDYITVVNNATGAEQIVPCIQIWVDPRFPHAHRDPALRAYLERRAADGWVGMVRLGAADGFVLVPPSMAEDGQWHEAPSQSTHRSHTVAETIASIAGGRDYARHPD